eukprot:TRINITY_DN572_c0_g1_i6.p1 TRINITY_DN572_c0_g1~~TRINITY_DN572_c0_g1_i6.p1  ORF type:complete len:552 (+),score=101.35 TRINITY_DN572_c0_g1_i6:79-1734(+)
MNRDSGILKPSDSERDVRSKINVAKNPRKTTREELLEQWRQKNKQKQQEKPQKGKDIKKGPLQGRPQPSRNDGLSPYHSNRQTIAGTSLNNRKSTAQPKLNKIVEESLTKMEELQSPKDLFEVLKDIYNEFSVNNEDQSAARICADHFAELMGIRIADLSKAEEELRDFTSKQDSNTLKSPYFWVLFLNYQIQAGIELSLLHQHFLVASSHTNNHTLIEEFRSKHKDIFERSESHEIKVREETMSEEKGSDQPEEESDKNDLNEKNDLNACDSLSLKRPPEDVLSFHGMNDPELSMPLPKRILCETHEGNMSPHEGTVDKRSTEKITTNRKRYTFLGLTSEEIAKQLDGGSCFKYQLINASKSIKETFGVEKILTPIRSSQRLQSRSQSQKRRALEKRMLSVRFVEKETSKFVYVPNETEKNFIPADDETAEVQRIAQRLARKPTPYSKSSKDQQEDDGKAGSQETQRALSSEGAHEEIVSERVNQKGLSQEESIHIESDVVGNEVNIHGKYAYFRIGGASERRFGSSHGITVLERIDKEEEAQAQKGNCL